MQQLSALQHHSEKAPMGAAAVLSSPRPDVNSRQVEQSQIEIEKRQARALCRELAQLADKFPRFQSALTRLRNHVEVQTRSEAWKRQAVLGCLSDEPMSIEGIIEETDLDRQNILQALVSLDEKGDAEKCNWNGRSIRLRRDGKPMEKIYWRRAAHTTRSVSLG